MLKLGDKAPDFTAINDTGAVFHLAEHLGQGHVVLYFYPRDFTIGCIKEACDFRDNYEALASENAFLAGVSTDAVESHQRFREKYKLPFPLIADPDRMVAALYDVDRSFPFASTQRVTYVITKDGVVGGVFQHELAIGKHPGDALATLRRLNAEVGERS